MTTLAPLLEAFFLIDYSGNCRLAPTLSLLIAIVFASCSPSLKNISSKPPPPYCSPISMLLS